jgi:hypothetical protein
MTPEQAQILVDTVMYVKHLFIYVAVILTWHIVFSFTEKGRDYKERDFRFLFAISNCIFYLTMVYIVFVNPQTIKKIVDFLGFWEIVSIITIGFIMAIIYDLKKK